MRTQLNYDLRSENGCVLFLPPHVAEGQANLKEPDVYAESLKQLYPIGSLAWFPGMGKKYRYAKAAQDIRGTKFLAAFGNYVPDGAGHVNEHGFYVGSCLAASVSPVGATEITFADTINKAKDFYEGAYFLHFDAGRNTVYEDAYIISGPPTNIVTPWECTVQLHKPLKYAIILGDGFEIWCNPYMNIRQGCVSADAYDGFETYAGVNPIPIQKDYYFWLQTAGPCFITPDGWAGNCPGFTVNSRVASAGLSSGNMNSELVLGAGYQKIGELLTVTFAGQGDALIDLKLDLGG